MANISRLLLLVAIVAAIPSLALGRQLPAPDFPPEICALPPARTCNVPSDYATLGEALTASPSCGTIHLGPGAHTGRVNVTRSVEIEGSGAAFTFLEGGGATGPTGSVLNVDGPLSSPRVCVQVRDLTIRNGRATDGGGIVNHNSILVVENAIIVDNQATGAGGGVFNHGGAVTRLSKTLIRDNVAGVRGGGVANNGIGSNFPGVSAIQRFFNEISAIAQSDGHGSLDFGSMPRVIGDMGSAVVGVVGDLLGNLSHFDLNAIQFPMVLLDDSDVTNNRLWVSEYEKHALGLGGGIYNQVGIIGLIDHSVVSHNDASALGFSAGGGIANLLGLMMIVDADVSDNQMVSGIAMGGGIFNVGAIEMRRVGLERNSIEGYGFARGGGLQTSAGYVNVVEGRITANKVSSITIAGGGGIGTDTFGAVLPLPESSGTNQLIAGVTKLTDSTISDNEVFSHFGASGGGIRNEEKLTIVRSTISGNRVRGGPSLIQNLDSTPLNLLVSGARGGGLFTADGAVTIASSTFSGNSVHSVGPQNYPLPFGASWHGASRGGAIFNEANDPDPSKSKLEIPAFMNVSPLAGNAAIGGFSGVDITRTTIFGNSVTGDEFSTAQGGGIYNRAFGLLSSAAINVKGTIIAGRTGANCFIDTLPGLEGTAPIHSQGHNLDSANSCNFTGSGDVIHADPLLGPLQDNGGLTFTHVADIGSPALNGGFAIGTADCDANIDQRQRSGAYQAACDIGSVEGGNFTLTSTLPQSNAPSVFGTDPIVLTFTDDLDPASATAATLRVRSTSRGNIAGTFSYQAASRRLLFQPEDPLYPGDTIEVSATRGLQNTFGISLSRARTWQFMVATAPFCQAPGFTPAATLPGTNHGSIEWGDYDGDGDLDLLSVGVSNVTFLDGVVPMLEFRSEIYRNDAGVFTPINAGLKNVGYGNGTWGDYDNDGDLDVLIMGRIQSSLNVPSGYDSGFMEIYRNDGGTFHPIGAGLPNFENGHASWGDWDGDGDLDILATGLTFLPVQEAWAQFHTISASTRSKIFVNNGGRFVDIGAALPDVTDAKSDWGDYDGDGDLDVVINGNIVFQSSFGTARFWGTQLYRNDGGGLTEIPLLDQEVADIRRGAISWADYDADGDLDIVLSGEGPAPGFDAVTRLYRNTNGFFASVDVPLPGADQGTLSWGDYDGDRDLDLLISGGRSSIFSGASTLMRNDGAAGFVDAGPGLRGLTGSSSAFGDFNGDGRLDIALIGKPDLGPSTIALFISASCQPTTDAFTTPLNEPFTVAAPGLLSNDTNSVRPLASPTVVTPPAHGQVTSFVNGGFTYTPDAGFSGTDTFTYQATDGTGLSGPGVASITVLPTPVACVATIDNGATLFKSIDGQALRDALAAAPNNGTVLVAGVCAGIASPSSRQVLTINKNITITGGYTRNDWTTRDASNPTILDAQGAGRVLEITPGVEAWIWNVAIRNGDAGGGDGGGILNRGRLRLFDSTISGNRARNGGGLYMSTSDPVSAILTSTLSNNHATGSGGAVHVPGGSSPVSIFRSTLSGNSAGQDGGAIRVDASSVSQIQHSTISGNTAARNGGGISTGPAGAIDVFNDTVNDNAAIGPFAFGGGLHASGGTLRVFESIIANSPGGNCAGVVAGLNYNLVSDNTCNFHNLNDRNDVNPLLLPLANNGGLTQTHALSYRSSAINAAGGCSGTTDQRGEPRPASGGCDIGAYELNVPPVAAENDSYGAAAGSTLTIPVASGVLANDFNQDGASSLLSAILVSGPAQGTLTLNANGSFTYQSAAGFTGETMFTYRAQDGIVESNAATATIRVTNLLTCSATIDGQQVFTSADAGAVQQAIDAADPGSLIKIAGTCAGVTGSQTAFINKSLTLQGGYAPAVFGDWIGRNAVQFPTTLDAQEHGGVVRVAGGTVGLDGLTMARGRAQDGAGILNEGGTVAVSNSTIRNNIATVRGGGVSNEAAMTIDNAIILNNTAQTGGGIANNGSMTVTMSLVQDNLVPGTGAGVVNLNTMTIRTTSIRGNRLNGPLALGGGVMNDAVYAPANLTIDRSTISGNIGSGLGNSRGAVLTVTSSTISGNSAVGLSDGGGLYIDGGTATLRSSLITGNTSGRGGGIAVFTTTGASTVNLQNTIVGANSQVLLGNCFGTITSQGNNLDSDDSCTPAASDRTGNLGIGALADNGGPTFTHKLTLASLAREHGASCPAIDQRGEVRPNQNGLCDIGPFELGGDPSILTIDDSYTTVIGAAVVRAAAQGVLANDFTTTPAGSTLSAAVVQIPSHGVLSLQASGAFTYTPAAGFGGDDEFTYRVTAGAVQSNVATVRLAVRALLTCRASVLNGATFNSNDASAIQQAVDAAPIGGTVRVAGSCVGVSAPRTIPFGLTTKVITASLYIEKDVTVRGGFDGTNWNVSNPVTFPTLISAASLGQTIYVNSGRTVTVENLTVTGANTTNDGGAFSNVGSTVTLRGVKLNANFAHQGAAILNAISFAPGFVVLPAVLTVEDSTIDGNSSTAEGGAVFNSGLQASMRMVRSTLSNNQAIFRGGAVSVLSGGVEIVNSTISGNRSVDATLGWGGAFANRGGLSISYSTVAFNSAGARGGAFFGGASISNSIVANNTAPIGADCDSALGSGGYNIESGSTCGFSAAGDMQNTEPTLMPLAASGGPTFTHALIPGSRAANAALCSVDVSTDQRGVARPQGPGCDIGSHEGSDVTTVIVAVPAGGSATTDVDNDGATPDDPVEVTVTVPNGGIVSIQQSATPSVPSGFAARGRAVTITAPAGTMASPIVLAFLVDATQLHEGETPDDIELFRNDVLVAPCDEPGVAAPNPCVSSRVLAADGDVAITALTSAASVWTFGVSTTLPPAVTLGAAATITEGATFARAIAIANAGSATWTALVNYGDGSAAQPAPVSSGAFSLSHAYLQDGIFTLAATISNGAGTTINASIVVTVTNVAPAVSAGGAAAIVQAGVLQRAISFADPGADSWSAVVDYGDGSVPLALGVGANKSLSLSHQYTSAGSFTITVSVLDSDGATGSGGFTTSVSNLPPAAVALTSLTALEGSTAALVLGTFTDPGTGDAHSATINWGDGTTESGFVSENGGAGTVSGSHRYADSGNYVATVVVTDVSGGTATISPAISVNNVAPTVLAGGNLSIATGQSVTRLGQFLDPGADTWTADVDYGEGGVQPLTLNSTSFYLDHSYANGGTYAVTVHVRDDDGAVGSTTFTVNVTGSNQAPQTQSLTANPAAAQVGDPIALTVTFSDAGDADPHTITWSFGDGDVFGSSVAAGAIAHTVQHSYDAGGTFTIAVAVTDGHGATDTRTLALEVANNQLRFEPALNDQTIDEHRTMSLPIRASDRSNGNGITVEADDLPPGATLEPVTNQPGHALLSWQPACDQAGTYGVTIRASSTSGAHIEQLLTIEVDEACEFVIGVIGKKKDTPAFVVSPLQGPLVTPVAGGTNLVATAFIDKDLTSSRRPARMVVVDGGHGQTSTLQVWEGPGEPTVDTLAAFRLVATIPVAGKAVGVSITPDGQQAWIGNQSSDVMQIVDLAAGSVISSVPLRVTLTDRKSTVVTVGLWPTAAVFSPDGRYAFIAATKSKAIVVVDRQRAIVDPANAVVTVVNLGGSPSALAMDSDRSRVYATTEGGLAVLDTSTPSSPALLGVVVTGNNPQAVAVDEDGSHVYVVNEQSSTVSVLATGPGLPVITKSIAAGHKPNQIVVSRTKIYVTSPNGQEMLVFDRDSGQLIGAIPLDSQPTNLSGGLLPTKP